MEKGKISSLQMAMLMYPTIVATAILSVPSLTAKFAQQDLWLSPILASIIGFVTVYITVSLHKLYPGQTIVQFSEHIIGRFPGKILDFFILSFYLITTGVVVRVYAEFIVGSFLFKTPISLIISLMALLCAFSVHGGLEVVGRVAQLIFPIFVIPLIILIILLSRDFEISNILPILERGIIPPLKGAIVPFGWFSEFFLIIFLLPFLADMKKGMKYGIMTVFVVMVTLVGVNLIVLFVLGTTIDSKVYPLMVASRYISLADFFENLESVVMALWIVGAFVKISMLYYVVALGTAQWLNLTDYRPIIWPIGILIVEFSFWSLPNTMEYSRYTVKGFPFYAILIQTIIPLFLLIIAVLRKRKRKPLDSSKNI
ncbi:endospore germination permease [Bacillus sp. JJ1532]|uniref:GerAB/ArcD/ProY family transporter n=1 Tax=unclassified Bacillus (in: firmicutes) TaxID=185979 RepID=UPI002FFDBCA2